MYHPVQFMCVLAVRNKVKTGLGKGSIVWLSFGAKLSYSLNQVTATINVMKRKSSNDHQRYYIIYIVGLLDPY